MEEELEKTKQSYQTQISSHEKKAHNNWASQINTNIKSISSYFFDSQIHSFDVVVAVILLLLF